MGLQTENLTMTALAVLKDNPVHSLQPPLPTGVHLRWQFKRERGFPWAGYYVFRRRSREKKSLCLDNFTVMRLRERIAFAEMPAGSVGEASLRTSGGTFFSDTPIGITRVEPASPMPEIALFNRKALLFNPANGPANRIRLAIYFMEPGQVSVTWKMNDRELYKEVRKAKGKQTITFDYAFDCITQVQISEAPAVLANICCDMVMDEFDKGWETISGFTYPYPLPVASPDYPCIKKPASVTDAKNMAAGRITYGSPGAYSARFTDLYKCLEEMVKGGPSAGAMCNKTQSYTNSSPGATVSAAKLPSLGYLDTILLASIQPPAAQMVGLYFVDTTAKEDVDYDYLIAGDFSGRLTKNISKLKEMANGLDPAVFIWTDDELDGWICFNQRLQINPELKAPTQVQAFALPGMSTRDNSTGLIKNIGRNNSAGLRWDISLNNPAQKIKNQVVAYMAWFNNMGTGTPQGAVAPDKNKYDPISRQPILLSASTGDPSQNAGQFPPFRLFVYHNYLPDGWYSYRVNGIDIFGRYSDLSEAAPWYQWAPAPQPNPWYYQLPESFKQLHNYAVHLRDTSAPPPPTAIEAMALDPLDPMVTKDAAYNNWMTSLQAAPWYQALTATKKEQLVGLRVRWQWTLYHMRQAPLTDSFCLYHKASHVYDAANSDPAHWDVRLHTVPYNTGFASFIHTQTDDTGLLLKGSGTSAAALSGDTVTVPAGFKLDKVRPGIEQIQLINTAGTVSGIFEIDKVNAATRNIKLKTVPSGFGANVQWNTGLIVRQYEVFLPTAGGVMPNGVPNFDVNLTDPINYNLIGLSTVEKKPDGTLIEGVVGPPATINRVLRTKPVPPQVYAIADSERVYATPADYYSKSYYTCRWLKQAGYKTHIYRALDESVFTNDYNWRLANAAPFVLSATSAAHAGYFPPEAIWTAAKKQAVATALNALNTLAQNHTPLNTALQTYRKLKDDEIRVLASLPGADGAFMQITIQPLDPDDAQYANRAGPDDAPGYVVDSNPSVKIFTDTLPGNARNRYLYRYAYVDPVQNRSAFSIASLPVYLPDVLPSPAPVITKIINGDKKITLNWVAQDIPGLTVYKVYRTENKNNTGDLRLLGSPVAVLPAAVLTVSGNAVNMGAGVSVASVQKVYAAAAFNPSGDWLTGQSATNYFTGSSTLTGAVINNIVAADGTKVVVVYTDTGGTLQCSAAPNSNMQWCDEGLIGGTSYYYLLAAIKKVPYRTQTLEVQSQVSAVAIAVPVESSAPAAAVISQATYNTAAHQLTVRWHTDYPMSGKVLVQTGGLATRVALGDPVNGALNNATGLWEYTLVAHCDLLDATAKVYVEGVTKLSFKTLSAAASPVIA